jgi:hypothetical protein
MKTRVLSFLVCILVIVGLTTIVFAAPPTGANSVSKVNSSRRTDFNDTVKTVDAQAGNVTELQINITMQTNHWQGYYGNISGRITLDDASNFSMYQWTNIDGVTGNIFATEASSVTWANVICANISATMNNSGCGGTAQTSGDCLNITEMNTKYGMNSNDGDGVDKTFTSTSNINIDTLSLTSCPATNLFENDTAQTGHWDEVLLNVNNTEDLVFAAVTEDDVWGFNNKTWDFQMLVGENEAVGTTTYYFYVELA